MAFGMASQYYTISVINYWTNPRSSNLPKAVLLVLIKYEIEGQQKTHIRVQHINMPFNTKTQPHKVKQPSISKICFEFPKLEKMLALRFSF